MNITEETQKLAGNPLLRYGVLMIGLLIIILSQGVLTWKRTSPRDAMGEIAQIQLDIKYYQKDLDEAEKAAEKKGHAGVSPDCSSMAVNLHVKPEP